MINTYKLVTQLVSPFFNMFTERPRPQFDLERRKTRTYQAMFTSAASVMSIHGSVDCGQLTTATEYVAKSIP